MKKRIFVILSAILVCITIFTACSSPSISISETASSYLQERGVTTSSISSIDFKEVLKRVPPKVDVLCSEISSRIHEFLGYSYTFVEEKGRAIVLNDAVTVDFNVTSESGEILYSDSNVIVVVGTGLFDGAVEAALVGKKVGSEFVLKSDSTKNQVFRVEKSYFVKVHVLSIGKYEELSETSDFLRENGFDSFAELYEHLYTLYLKELKFEKDSRFQSDLIQAIVDCCDYELSVEDVTNYASGIIDSYRGQAESLRISLEEFYSEILKMDEETFLVHCAEEGAYGIKKALAVGAIAEKYGISPDQSMVDKYLAETENTNEKLSIYVEFDCLCQAVCNYYS